MDSLSPDSELAKFKPLSKWVPKVGDFVIHHGWFFSKWYGVISSISQSSVEMITDGLPVLLFTMVPEQQDKKKKIVSIAKIKMSRGGEFAVNQDNVWHVDG